MTSHLVQDWAARMLLAGGRPEENFWGAAARTESDLFSRPELIDALVNLPAHTLLDLAGPYYRQKTQSYIEIDASLAKILDRPAQAFRLTTAEVFIEEPGKAMNGKPGGSWLAAPHLAEIALGVM